MPLRTPNLQLPEVEIDGLTIRETNASEDREQLDDKEYEIVAEFEAERDEVGQKKAESHERAKRFAYLFSFVTGNGILVEEPRRAYSVSRGGLVETTGTTLFPHEWYKHIEAIFDNLENNISANDEILRSLRWYSQSTVQGDDTDAFLSLWLSLEILSDKQEKTIAELDSIPGNPVDEAMRTIRQNVDSSYLKQEINDFLRESFGTSLFQSRSNESSERH